MRRRATHSAPWATDGAPAPRAAPLSHLCVPPPPEDDEKHRSRLRVSPEQVAWLEQCIDEINATLPPLTSFVVPGGTALSAFIHVARTICRRAERDAVARIW